MHNPCMTDIVKGMCNILGKRCCVFKVQSWKTRVATLSAEFQLEAFMQHQLHMGRDFRSCKVPEDPASIVIQFTHTHLS